MRVETDEPEVIERVVALDVGQGGVVCCRLGAGFGPSADGGGPSRR